MDRILTYQQSSLLQDIESYLHLSKRGGAPEVLNEIWLSILDLVEMDPDLYPPELQPTVYFKSKTVFVRKATPRDARAYLHRLHKYIDSRTSRRLGR